MSWKVRHAGSSRFVGDLNAAQILQGVLDGQWHGDDEVMGPGEKRWVTLAEHPQFEEPIAVHEENEEGGNLELEDQHIDMNPLIDVCLVLLVFFILATTMAVLEKVLDIPESKESQEVKVVPQETLNQMIQVKAYRKGPRDPVATIEVEGQQVPLEGLTSKLRRFVSESKRTEMVIDAKDVDWGTVVVIIDAAGSARINKVHFKGVAPPGKGGAPAK